MVTPDPRDLLDTFFNLAPENVHQQNRVCPRRKTHETKSGIGGKARSQFPHCWAKRYALRPGLRTKGIDPFSIGVTNSDENMSGYLN